MVCCGVVWNMCCGKVKCGRVWCDIVSGSVVWCGGAWCDMVWYSVVWCDVNGVVRWGMV